MTNSKADGCFDAFLGVPKCENDKSILQYLHVALSLLTIINGYWPSMKNMFSCTFLHVPTQTSLKVILVGSSLRAL